MSDPLPGTVIRVRINGAEAVTIIDDNDVQRLQTRHYLKEIVDCGAIDLNRLSIAVKRDGSCSRDARRWLYQNIGYSLSGYAEIFPEDEIENPLWDGKGDR